VILENDRVRFVPAADLLGLSARETTKAIRERLGDRTTRVCAIGRAGEAGVRFAAVENDGRQAGRGGTGDVKARVQGRAGLDVVPAGSLDRSAQREQCRAGVACRPERPKPVRSVPGDQGLERRLVPPPDEPLQEFSLRQADGCPMVE